MDNEKRVRIIGSIILLHLIIFTLKYHKISGTSCPYAWVLPILFVNDDNYDILNSKCRYNVVKLLELLVQNGGQVKIETLASELNVSRKVVKNYILKLEKNGLVKRLDKETFAITELGERVLSDIKSKGF